MKRFCCLIFAIYIYTFLFSQSLDYEWKEVTSKYARLEIEKKAYTKNGRVVVLTTEGWLAETIDSGKTWNATYDVMNLNENIYTRETEYSSVSTILSFSPDSLHGFMNAIYVKENVSYNIHLFSTDGGHTWKPSQTVIDNKNKILKTVWKDDETIFAGVFNSDFKEVYLYKSIDAGNHWEKITDNLLFHTLNYDTPEIYMAFVNEQLGYIFTWGGYFVTTDGGNSWIRNTLEIIPKYLFQFNNGQILLTVYSSVEKTISGCKIINFPNTSDNSFNTPVFLYDLGNGSVKGFLSGSGMGEFIISTDSLLTWEYSQDAFLIPPSDIDNKMSEYIYWGNMQCSALYVKSSQDLYIIGKQNGRLFHSSDGGETWSYKDFNTTLYTMQFFQNDVIYMSSSDSLFISRDGGDTWTGKYQYWSGAIGNKRMQFFSEKIGYIYDDYRLFQTHDGGDSWKEIEIIGDEFWDYGGTLNGCFANERSGLFRSENSKIIMAANIDSEKNTIDFSVVTSTDIKGTKPIINITYHNYQWILTDSWSGYIYTCDTNYSLKIVAEPENYHRTNPYNTLLNYGDGLFLLTELSERTENNTAYASFDNGNTWQTVSFICPMVNIIEKSDNPNVLYACSSTRNFRIYKGVHKVRASDSFFEKQENGTIQCLISNAENQTYTAKVLVEQVNGASIVVSENIEIKSGEPFVITLPKGIEANYVIKVIPEDDEVFEMVQSQEFIVNNGGSAIDPVSADDIQIRVVNGRIECDCEDYTIYNVAGQKVQNNALPSATYFVHCGTQVKKVVVQ